MQGNKRRLRIVLLRFGSPYGPDGVNNSIYILAEAFMKLGHEPVILGGFGMHPGEDMLTNVFDVEKVPNITTLSEKEPHFRALLWLNWFKKGSKIINELAPDIIIANGIIPVPRTGFKILYIYDIPPTLRQRILGIFLIKKYDAIIFISSFIKKSFTKSRKVRDKKCGVIPLPIDPSRYKIRRFEEREHAILFVNGRKRRNLSLALKIFSNISRHDSDVVLYIVGRKNIPLGNYPRDRVIATGFIDRRALRELYSKVKLLLIPSDYEGFGYPVLEAFASGTPVVGSNAIPPELLINGYNGFRIKHFKPEPYIEAIFKLLSDEELWIKMHKNALRTSNKYNGENIAIKFIELYRSALGLREKNKHLASHTFD